LSGRHPRTLCAVWLAVWLSHPAAGRSGKIQGIDALCQATRQEFVEGMPRYFSGPDPWLEGERWPASLASGALAGVYAEGARVRWVVLQISGPGHVWSETTDYFFDEAGVILKRERRLEHIPANVRVEESTYFQRGKVIRTRYRHTPLQPATRGKPVARGKEDWDKFFDPNAPEYRSTGDLPVLFREPQMRQVSQLGELPVCVPAVLKRLTKGCNNC
jgi:hypothetical protein